MRIGAFRDGVPGDFGAVRGSVLELKNRLKTQPTQQACAAPLARRPNSKRGASLRSRSAPVQCVQGVPLPHTRQVEHLSGPLSGGRLISEKARDRGIATRREHHSRSAVGRKTRISLAGTTSIAVNVDDRRVEAIFPLLWSGRSRCSARGKCRSERVALWRLSKGPPSTTSLCPGSRFGSPP